MKTFMVEYSLDKGATKDTMLVSADDYTKAYLSVCYQLPIDAVIIELFEIK